MDSVNEILYVTLYWTMMRRYTKLWARVHGWPFITHKVHYGGMLKILDEWHDSEKSNTWWPIDGRCGSKICCIYICMYI